MSSEIIPVLMRGYSRAPGGSRSVGRSPALRDSRGLGGFYPTGSLIAFIWCPGSKNSSSNVVRMKHWQHHGSWGPTLKSIVSLKFFYVVTVCVREYDVKYVFYNHFLSVKWFIFSLCVCLWSGLWSKVPLHRDVPRHYSQQPLLSLSHSAGITALPAASSAAAAAATAAHTGGRSTGKTYITHQGSSTTPV